MMKRCLSLLLVIALIVALAVPVSADGNSDGWIEFLEITSVQANGENWMEIKGSSTVVSIPLQSEHRLARLELLVWHQTADYPNAVSVTANGATYPLTVIRIDNNLSRVFGEIPNAFYQTISIKFNKPTSNNAVWELLSLKGSPTAKATYNADAEVWCREDNNYVSCPGTLQYYGQGDGQTVEAQFPIIIYDWKKYDSITVTGSLSYMGLNSVRASIGTLGLPYEITYTSTNPTGSWSSILTHEDIFHYESDGYGYSSSESIMKGDINEQMLYNGKVLYNVTIDLTGVDRTIKDNLMLYFTGVINGNYGYMVQVVGVVGTVDTADTSSFSWWNRFTTFMTDLFGGDDPGVLDDLGDSSNSISSNTDQIHGFEQSQQAVLDNNFTQIQTAVTFTNFAAALVFVQKYANMTFSGISGYAIVFTLPLFLGLFFYLCSRIPGITRWKTPPPRSKPKGGGKP